jgi:hypothetical protein
MAAKAAGERLVLHCAGGEGRTGTVLAQWLRMEQLGDSEARGPRDAPHPRATQRAAPACCSAPACASPARGRTAGGVRGARGVLRRRGRGAQAERCEGGSLPRSGDAGEVNGAARGSTFSRGATQRRGGIKLYGPCVPLRADPCAPRLGAAQGSQWLSPLRARRHQWCFGRAHHWWALCSRPGSKARIRLVQCPSSFATSVGISRHRCSE